jgi:Fanconi anemia group M protein
VQINTINLEVGDYLVGNTIIERKTFSDFISSMLSKRLFEQLNNMKQYNKRLLILEGRDFEKLNYGKINPNSLRGLILSISLEYEIPIIFTMDSKETATYLYLLAKRGIKSSMDLTFHTQKGQTKKEKIKYIVESFSNIGPKNAEKLLKKFKTIKNIVNASKEELYKEIGKKAEEFSILDEEY